MSRLAPYLGIVVALILGIFIVAFSGSVTVVRVAETNLQAASSTLLVLPDLVLPDITLPQLAPAEQKASVPEKTVSPAASMPVPTPAPTPVIVSAPVPDAGALDRAASTLRAALVNIICYMPAGSGLHSISGSGVIVDAKGFILTNAHIAQYFLLADRGADCTIRAGSPAADRYDAALAYIPSAWLSENANVLTLAAPTGTGEYDFAILAVTKSATRDALPAEFPFISLAQTPPSAGTRVVIASYGAQFLESSQIQSALFPIIVFGSVKGVFTFKTNTIDVLSLGGSAAAQEGSSGGGVADASEMLVATITTSTVEGATETRSLDAVTASYIRATYAGVTGQALDLLFAKSPPTAAADFAPQIPTLEAIVTANLP